MKHLSEDIIKKYNSLTVSLLSLFLNLAPDTIDMEAVDSIADSCHVSREFAYAECLAAVCGLDAAGAQRDYFNAYFVPMIHELDVKDFISNQFYQNIHIPPAVLGKWELKEMCLHPGEAFVCGDFTVTDDKRMIPQIGYFSEEFKYPAVLENGREWMTLMPNETVTSQPAVDGARGNVLTFGVGLGYFLYMASEKPEVEAVTAVDISPEVNTLFEEYILPQFPHKEKITLICADAFEFAENKMSAQNYDFVFADIWHDVGDGRELYIKMKEYETVYRQTYKNTAFCYWLENSIKCYLDKELWL